LRPATSRIVSIYNVPAFGAYLDKGMDFSPESNLKLEQSSQFFALRRLTEHPYKCDLLAEPAGARNEGRPAITAEVVGHYHSVYDERTVRDTEENYTVDVVANGQTLGTLDLMYGRQSDVTSIEVSADGVGLVYVVYRSKDDGPIPFPGQESTVGCHADALH
jgi:hypothetical protein